MFAKHPASPEYGSTLIRYKGGGTTTISQPTQASGSNTPWSAQIDPLKFGFDEARRQYDDAKPEYYPSSTVTPFNETQLYAQDAASNRALEGNPLLPAAQQQTQRTLQGDYLNPDISGVAASIDEQLRPRIGAQFAQAGRSLSPAHAGTYASGFTNAIAPYAFNANQNERGRMMQAAETAPGLAQADYFDIGRLADVGGQQQAMSQNLLSDDISRYDFEQNVEQNKLRQFMANISGNYGGTRTTSTTQPIYSNPTASMLGNVGSAVGIAQGAKDLSGK